MKNDSAKLKKNIILFIDTSSSKTIKVRLSIGKEKCETRRRIGHQKTQVVLPLIDALLRKQHLSLSDIEQIKVKTGMGSFTGLRVGIAIANALSFALRIPVNEKKIGQFVEPQYE